ncbi:hypothetical protein V5799_005406, partial [Amblyomma americanum]
MSLYSAKSVAARQQFLRNIVGENARNDHQDTPQNPSGAANDDDTGSSCSQSTSTLAVPQTGCLRNSSTCDPTSAEPASDTTSELEIISELAAVQEM